MKAYHNSIWVSCINYICNCCLMSIVSDQSQLIALKYKDVRESQFPYGNLLLCGIQPQARGQGFFVRLLMEQEQFLRTRVPIFLLVFFLFTTELQWPKDTLILNSGDTSPEQLILNERLQQLQCSQHLTSSIFKETSEPYLCSQFFALQMLKERFLSWGGLHTLR